MFTIAVVQDSADANVQATFGVPNGSSGRRPAAVRRSSA